MKNWFSSLIDRDIDDMDGSFKNKRKKMVGGNI